ncbi:MAG: dienelactone hydrolase family protein [Burkholderiaceae bacterium]|nr:dienelactone hydrolase family protein [Burkholderiaceae bacterium]
MLPRRTVLATPLLMSACATPPSPPAPREEAVSFDLGDGGPPLRVLVHRPRGHARADGGWPLLIFLHGSGERGHDLQQVKVNGPPKLAAAGRDYPCLLMSPQWPEGDWDPQRLHRWLQVLKAANAHWRFDPDQVLVTGLSRGGHGAWTWAAAFPQDMAAIAPICGWLDPALACRVQVPVRAYHGDADTVVTLDRQRAPVEALRACGGRVEFIVYPGVGHDAWTAAYDDPALLPWLLAQRRRR